MGQIRAPDSPHQPLTTLRRTATRSDYRVSF
jgi:hypothetical protein